ncbi:MAG: arylesterase [Gammaproteobacteria bacterium]
MTRSGGARGPDAGARLVALRGWLLAVVALGLAACDSPPDLSRLGADAVVLAFGDSLTFGTGARPEQSYPSVLASATGRTVVNAGRPGETTTEGLRRLPQVLADVQPGLVILCHGGNDFLRKMDRSATERNLRRMVELVRAAGAEVVLVGVPTPGLFLSGHELYERVADDLKIPLEQDVVADLLGDNGYKSDAVHPNAAGYARMAEAIRAILSRAGAL